MADESNISAEDNPAEEINTTRESWESEFEDFHIPEMTVAGIIREVCIPC